MKKEINSLMNLWKEEVSDHIKKYVPYHVTEQLKRMAALFLPGSFYYFIVNFKNLHFDYVSEGTEEVLGIAPKDFTVYRFLEKLPKDELEKMKAKEAFAVDFLFNFLNPDQIPLYKVMYFMQVEIDRKIKNILHQTISLTVSESGKVEHVLTIHTDVSHLNLIKANTISFISLDGKQSYYNLDPGKLKFDPNDSHPERLNISNSLTPREIEIIRFLARGYSAKKIADELFVSFNTVRTHRKNILEKTGCTNTSELVARCVIDGII